MSGSKHTPGPWSVSKYGDDYNITYDTDGNWLATVYDDDDPVAGRPEADAILIAAAPELLEALKGLLADIEEYQRINKLGGEDNHWQVISRAAIAKAEGQS